MADFKRCVAGYTSTKKECTDLRDDGYSKCTDWGQNCTSWAKDCVVSWIPLIGPAICKVFEWVCKATEWICTAAVWVANLVCHAFKLIFVFVCTLWEAASWLLTIPAIFIKLVFAIPGLGGLIKQVINFVTGSVLGIVGGFIEGVICGLLGICPAKHIRLCVIISRGSGGGPVATPADLQPIIDRTKQIFKDEANVDLWVTVNEGRDGPVLTGVKCDAAGWLQDLGTDGMTYELSEGRYCGGGAIGSIIGLASPIYAFVVEDVARKNGCSLWWLANYLVFESAATASCMGNTHLAHEMGHVCGLPHVSGKSNLMYPSCNNPGRDQLSGFQKSVIRGSKYAQYF